MNIDFMSRLCKWMMNVGLWQLFKWLMNVVVKLLFVIIVGLLIISIGTFAFGVDANAIFVDSSVWKIVESYFQHMPRIGMLAEGMSHLVGAVGKKVSAMEVSIYEEILRCCIYMMIVRCFDATIRVVTKIFRLFMLMGKITNMLADGTVYVLSYALAIGVADLLYDGMVRRIPANIACWVMAGTLILISVALLVIRRKTILASFLELIGGGLLDIMQLVLMYFAVMCVLIMDNTTIAAYLTGGEQVLITACVFAALALFSISFIRRLISAMK